MENYIAKKRFGKPLAQLKDQEQTRVSMLTSGPEQGVKPNFFDRTA